MKLYKKLLVRDDGYRQMIIRLYDPLATMTKEDLDRLEWIATRHCRAFFVKDDHLICEVECIHKN